MKYTVRWQEEAQHDLLALPDKIAVSIVKKVESYLAQDPRGLGKPLKGRFAKAFRYRFGDYRIIYEIVEKEICIYVVRIGHRKDVYD